MKKLIAIVVAVTLVAVGSGVALAAFPYVTATPQYPQVKVAQVPIPWQFWAIEPGLEPGTSIVTDLIRISPTWLSPPGDQPPGEGAVFISRQFVVVPEEIPLLELVWGSGPVPSRPDLEWELVDPDPIEVPVGEDVELPILVTPDDGAVLVAYEVTTEAGDVEGHFINEAILESSSPREIVRILVNFDIHNGTGRDDITNFELDFLGLEFSCEDIVDALGFVVPDPTQLWGANEDNPLVVRHIPGGTEVKWVEPDRPLANCEWLHVGLMFNYSGGFVDNINATVQGYWTVLGVPVTIDIKPGSDPNSINLKSKGVVPVAVLTTEDFDASTIDPTTVEFAGAPPVRSTLEDVDGDGDVDMLFHFKTQELEDLDENSTEATLYSYDPLNRLIGTDSVNIVPKGKGSGKK